MLRREISAAVGWTVTSTAAELDRLAATFETRKFELTMTDVLKLAHAAGSSGFGRLVVPMDECHQKDKNRSLEVFSKPYKKASHLMSLFAVSWPNK